MPTPASLARAHARRQAALTRQTAITAAAVWTAVDLADLDGTWSAIADRAVELLTAGQYAAAAQAADYVTAQAAAQGLDTAVDGLVDARAFAGTASDGRSLDTLLRQAIIDTKVAIRSGMTGREARTRGLASLTLRYVNEVAQAGRNADHVAITAAPVMTGYVRMLQGVSCSRCTILAGKFYRWNAGFPRHPHCDCVHVPAQDAARVQDVRTDPRATFDSLTTEQQDAIYTKAGAQAIRDGADISQVVNARRGMTAFGVSETTTNTAGRTVNVSRRRFADYSTTEGANITRGRYGRQAAEATGQLDQFQRRQNAGGLRQGSGPMLGMHELADVQRLTPGAIYRIADGRRQVAIDLLRRYGYLT